MTILSAEATAAALPYTELACDIEALLSDPDAQIPPRLVQALAGGGALAVMPAADAQIAITKVITFVADNNLRGLPAIQGDILVFDAHTGRRIALLDGPTVTARRTAAVSLLAAQHLTARQEGPLLIVGAGVQGRAHLEAFHKGLGVEEVWIASRTAASAQALAQHALGLGLRARVVADADAALADCPLVVSCTAAQGVVLRGSPRPDAFVAAVGTFTPGMAEWAPEVCQHLWRTGMLMVDTHDADHEAGDLLQAGIDASALPCLGDLVGGKVKRGEGPMFFKSCGWAGWDLAAARCVMKRLNTRPEA